MTMRTLRDFIEELAKRPPEPYPENVAKKNPDAIALDVVNLLRRYDAEDQATRRTEYLQQIGERLVDLRECFLTADGEPDWSGRSHAYKMAVSEIYSHSGLGARQASVATAVRYHVSNALRRRLSPEELDDLGLMHVSARERSVEHRADRSSLMAAMRPGSDEGAPLEPLQAAGGAQHLLKRITRRGVRSLSPRRAAALVVTLDRVLAEAERVREAAVARANAEEG